MAKQYYVQCTDSSVRNQEHVCSSSRLKYMGSSISIKVHMDLSISTHSRTLTRIQFYIDLSISTQTLRLSLSIQV